MNIFIATHENIDQLCTIRYEMLTLVNKLPQNYTFNSEFTDMTRNYFLSSNHSTVLATDGNLVIGCATLCYITILPTYSHPTGQRAHLMNVYISPSYRRKGIAYQMVSFLIEDAIKRNITEITLDATESGRPLYEKLGFKASTECMSLLLPR